MRVVRAADIGAVPARVEPQGGLRVAWFDEPARAERLDVGVVTVEAGAATPAHIHLQGQVMVVTDGSGWVEVGRERVVLGPGDLVVAAPGELHTHGAADDRSFTHINVTTGEYTFPDPPS